MKSLKISAEAQLQSDISRTREWNFIFFGVIKTDFFFSIVTDFRNKLTIDTFVLVFFTLWRFSPFRQLSCTVQTVVLFVRPVLHGNKHALYPSRSWKPSTRAQSFDLLITILIVFETALINQWNITTKKNSEYTKAGLLENKMMQKNIMHIDSRTWKGLSMRGIWITVTMVIMIT